MNIEKILCDDKLKIIMTKDIKKKKVKWLWYLYIPFGKFTLLQGNSGDSKSKLILNLLAMFTSGESLPFIDEPIEPIKIIF